MPYNLAIPGWMPESELKIIERLAETVPYGGNIVEVGAYCGRTTWCLAHSSNLLVTVFAIDEWLPDYPYYPPTLFPVNGVMPEPGPDFGIAESVAKAQGTYENFHVNTRDCGNVVPVKARSPDDFANFDMSGKLGDLIFLDGLHHNPGFHNDMEFWWKQLLPGGILAGHDCSRVHPDVVWETHDFAKREGVALIVKERIWMVVKPGRPGESRKLASLLD